MKSKEKLEELFGISLMPSYDSREDNNPDEVLGHFVCYEPDPLPFEEMADCPPIVAIYETGRVQFFHDASPYPTLSNTQAEVKVMAQCLNPFPTPIERITKGDWEHFINSIIKNHYE